MSKQDGDEMAGPGTHESQPGQAAQQSRTPRQQQPQQQPAPNLSNLDLLLPDEEVLIDARPAWTAWAGHLVLGGLILLAGLLANDQNVLVVSILAAGALAGYVWYQRRKVRYVITDLRVMVLTGITSKKTNEAWMEDVKGMQTGASWVERLLGHGHITVSREILPRGSLLPQSAMVGIGGKGMTLGGITNYEQIANTIRQRQAEQKGLQ